MAGQRDGAAGGRARRSRAESLFGAPAQPVTPAAGADDRPEAPPALRRAALVVGVEALALAGVAGVLLYLVLTSSATSVSSAVAEVVYVSLGAAALAASAVGLWRVAAWARGPVVVLQLLLAALGYTMAFEAQLPVIGLPVLALVAVVAYLLATPEARLAYLTRR